MFDFSIFITLLTTIIVFYLTIHITLKKEIDDITNKPEISEEDEQKMLNRKSKLFFTKIVAIIIILIITLLYKLPDVALTINNIKSSDFTPIDDILSKLIPSIKRYFSDSNFTFSFITGMVLSIIIEIALFYFLNYEIIIPETFKGYALQIIILILSIFNLIGINDYISTQLSYSIIHNFELLSIVINLVAYAGIAFIVYIILIFLSLLI